jgi:hypothetical protein
MPPVKKACTRATNKKMAQSDNKKDHKDYAAEKSKTPCDMI